MVVDFNAAGEHGTDCPLCFAARALRWDPRTTGIVECYRCVTRFRVDAAKLEPGVPLTRIPTPNPDPVPLSFRPPVDQVCPTCGGKSIGPCRREACR